MDQDNKVALTSPVIQHPKLKYLFTATFADGTSFSQGEDDVCSFDPKKSAFTELLKLMETKELRFFFLKGDGREIVLDMLTGHFQIDTLQFFVNQIKAPTLDGIPVKLKLIYFRAVEGVATLEISLDNIKHVGSEKRINAYCIGWEANVNGRVVGPCIFGVF